MVSCCTQISLYQSTSDLFISKLTREVFLCVNFTLGKFHITFSLLFLLELFFHSFILFMWAFTNWVHCYNCACNMHTVLQVHENSCMILIPLCKNNLNLPICSSFFLPCTWLLPPLVHYVLMLATSLHWFFCLFVFTEVELVAQP